jgi:hypothetical protein
MTTTTIVRPPARQDDSRPKIPHTAHMRELEMADGRKLLLDRRAIAFLCQGKPEEFGGKQVTIVAFKTQARACPVTAGYDDLKNWWHGSKAVSNAPAAA